jgi:phosphatidylserine/phosphatidylglycerophosphate/cardiolipin synthase-like enzyme
MRRRTVAKCLFAFAAAAAAVGPWVALRGQRETPVLRAFFSPGGGARKALEEALDSARRELRVAMYTFSSPPLARKVIAAHRRGVDVLVLLDDRENRTRRWSQAKALEEGGVPVRYVRPHPRKGDPVEAKFHHKFCVIDGRLVVTGSFNWSNMADTSNHENLLIIQSRDLARTYLRAFARAEELSRKR